MAKRTEDLLGFPSLLFHFVAIRGILTATFSLKTLGLLIHLWLHCQEALSQSFSSFFPTDKELANWFTPVNSGLAEEESSGLQQFVSGLFVFFFLFWNGDEGPA